MIAAFRGRLGFELENNASARTISLFLPCAALVQMLMPDSKAHRHRDELYNSRLDAANVNYLTIRYKLRCRLPRARGTLLHSLLRFYRSYDRVVAQNNDSTVVELTT